MANNRMTFALVALLVAVILITGMNGNKNSNANMEGFNSNVICSNYENAVLNGVGTGNLATGTAAKRYQNEMMIVHVQANLPETQATFELTFKDNCECHCNNLFDCHCGNGMVPGCPAYVAWLVNPNGNSSPVPIGRMYKFRDGLYRTTKKFFGAQANAISARNTKIIVTFEGNTGMQNGMGPSIPVLTGNFSARNIFCQF